MNAVLNAIFRLLFRSADKLTHGTWLHMPAKASVYGLAIVVTVLSIWPGLQRAGWVPPLGQVLARLGW